MDGHFRRLVIRLTLELGPLLVFFAVTQWRGVIVGTGAFMAATLAAALASWYRERRLPVLPFIGVGFALAFGGLTLVLDDPLYIMIRPTIFNTFAGGVLIVSVLQDRLLLAHVFGDGLPIPRAAWRVLTWRTALFFFVLAGLNELVRQATDVAFWVAFKTFAMPPLNFFYFLANWPFVRRWLASAGTSQD